MARCTMFLNWKKPTLLKLPYYPKAIYRLSAIPLKTPITLFIELEQIILTFAWKTQKLQLAKQS